MCACSCLLWFKFILQIISRVWASEDLLGLPNDEHNLVWFHSGFFVTIWINMSPLKNILVCSVIYIGIICSGISFPFCCIHRGKEAVQTNFKPLLKKNLNFLIQLHFYQGQMEASLFSHCLAESHVNDFFSLPWKYLEICCQWINLLAIKSRFPFREY